MLAHRLPLLRALFATTAMTLVLPTGGKAQETGAPADPGPTPADSRPIPADTYENAGVAALLARARGARSEVVDGLFSYEAYMWERVRVGLAAESFRFQRGVFTQERTARIRWSGSGDHILLWERARRDTPLTGGSSRRNAEMANDLESDLVAGGNALPAPLLYDPGSDRIAFGRDRVLNPIADTAVFHYRYFEGDRLRIGFDESGEEIVLEEVRVEPRRADPRLVTASLWFDRGSGILVRTSYRPSRPFDLIMDRADGKDEQDEPGFLAGKFLAQVNYVTVDHAYYDQRWWIPRRFAFEGSVQIAGLASLPIRVEWTLDEVAVNEGGELLRYLESLRADPPAGWTLAEAGRESDRGRDTVSIVVPSRDILNQRPLPSSTARAFPSTPARTATRALSREEAEAIQRALERMERAASLATTIDSWRARDGAIYFNRVEGLSIGVSASRPLATYAQFGGELRFGLSDRELGGEIGIIRSLTANRTASLSIYRRVDASSEWAGQMGFVSSMTTLLLGSEYTPFHRSWGGALTVTDRDAPIRSELRLFYERHASLSRATHAHLSRLWSEDLLPENPAATEGRWGGVSLDARWEVGSDPGTIRAFGRVRTEAAGGTTRYLRSWASMGTAFPLHRRVAAAFELGGGGTAGTLPTQRRFAPGGPSIYRGAAAGELFGEAFWFARAELGFGRPGARIVLFADAIEIVPTSTLDAFAGSDPEVAVGIGFSLLDGLFRMDVARRIEGAMGRDWKVTLYRDGLF